MDVLVTGADGFIGKNLIAHLNELPGITVRKFSRDSSIGDLQGYVATADFVFHLAGVNRPKEVGEFKSGNAELTEILCSAIKSTGRPVPVIYTSSIQATQPNPYGESKLGAEKALLALAEDSGSPVHIYRLPNVFGKWAKPNYNSVVATFCHNLVNGLPIQINDPKASLSLVYIDDVVEEFMRVMNAPESFTENAVEPTYMTTVGELASQLEAFRDSRSSLVTETVGTGLVRALYSTWLSYLPPDRFSYELTSHEDPRGVFVEMLKTTSSGQFSYFTAHPGITRGGHYHHSKTEKFLVIKGEACFRFRHIVTDEFYEMHSSGAKPEIVETVPGWTHDITNVGDDELIVMLWANEIFDRERPDTYARPVGNE